MKRPFDEMIGTEKTVFSFTFNVTQDLINSDITYMDNDQSISILQLLGLEAPCKYSDFIEKSRKYYDSEKSIQAHQVDKLIEEFSCGKREMTMEYMVTDLNGESYVLSENLILSNNSLSGDIIGTSYIRKVDDQKEEKHIVEQIKQMFHYNDALYNEILQMQNIGVIAYRLPNYEIQIMNEKALKIYGWDSFEQTREEIMRLAQRTVYENEMETKAKLHNIQNYKNGVSYVATIVRDDGTQVPVYATSKRIQVHPKRVIIVTILIGIEDIAKLAKRVGL